MQFFKMVTNPFEKRMEGREGGREGGGREEGYYNGPIELPLFKIF